MGDVGSEETGVGQVYLLPVGSPTPTVAELREMEPLGFFTEGVSFGEAQESFVKLADAFDALGKAAWSATFALNGATYSLMRKVFFPRPRKKTRKAIVRMRRQVNKYLRDVYRDSQRAAIGINV